MLIRKILIIGARDAGLILSPFGPEEISVIGKEEDIEQLRKFEDMEFAYKICEVKAAAVVYNWAGEEIFKRIIRRGIPVIIILSVKSRGVDRDNLKNSYIKNLMEMGAKGVFFKDFTENPLAIEEFYRQIKKLAA